MKNEIANWPNPDSLIKLIPQTQSELQGVVNEAMKYMDNLPKSVQIQTSQAEMLQYRQYTQNQEIKQNLGSTFGLLLILIGALVHIKLVYGNKPKILPKNLEESKYTLRGFIEQWNLHDNDF